MHASCERPVELRTSSQGAATAEAARAPAPSRRTHACTRGYSRFRSLPLPLYQVCFALYV